MNKKIVMRAIEKRMTWLFNNVWCNPKNHGKDLSSTKREITDLYNSYFELRGMQEKKDRLPMNSSQVEQIESVNALVNTREGE